MSIVFFVILIINCFVIFAADALLGGLAPQTSQQQHTVTLNTGQPGEHLLLHASPRFIRELLAQQNQHPFFDTIVNGGHQGQILSAATKPIASSRRYRRSATSSSSSSSSENIKTIFAEGGQSIEVVHKNGKVKPRKGAPDFNATPPPLPSTSSISAALPSSTIDVTPTISIPATNSSTNSPPSSITLEKSSIPDATSPNTNTSVENSSNTTNQSSIIQPITENITATPIVSNSSLSSLSTNSLTNSSTTIETGSTTTTSTTNTTTTTTTTTPPPPTTTLKPPEKKPKITYSILDDPTIENKSPETVYKPIKNSNVESAAAAAVAALASSSAESILNAPISQPSREILIDAPSPTNGRKYIIPIVALIFAIPMILTLAFALVRRFKSYWSTRHYRRMDFLIDGMYNS